MSVIFAIGGGELKNLETLEIDKKIVEAARKSSPKALFIPTASEDAEGYIETFRHVYGEKLGCVVDNLLLLNNQTTVEEARRKILDSDIIYVGGGNTKMMMEVWKEYGVDEALKEAYNREKVLAGLSAGSICWFRSGHSDSQSFERKNKWSYIVVEGLNFINAMHCPHYDEDIREPDFHEKILVYNQVGIALDNNCAIEVRDKYYKIHKSDENAKAYKIYLSCGMLIKEELNNTKEYKLLYELISSYDNCRE